MAVKLGVTVTAAKRMMTQAVAITDCTTAILHLHSQRLISNLDVDFVESWLVERPYQSSENSADASIVRREGLGRFIHGQHLILRDGKHGPLYEPGQLFIEQLCFSRSTL